MTPAEAAAGSSGSWRQMVASGVRWQGSGEGCLSAGSLGMGTEGAGSHRPSASAAALQAHVLQAPSPGSRSLWGSTQRPSLPPALG